MMYGSSGRSGASGRLGAWPFIIPRMTVRRVFAVAKSFRFCASSTCFINTLYAWSFACRAGAGSLRGRLLPGLDGPVGEQLGEPHRLAEADVLAQVMVLPDRDVIHVERE